MNKFKVVIVVAFLFTSVLATTLLVVANNTDSTTSKTASAETPIQKAGKVFKKITNTEPPREFLLPDQVITKPRQIYISSSGEERTIRFSTTFMNIGEGPLEIHGHQNEIDQIVYASQYIWEIGGPGDYKHVGDFVFHPDHTHWHVEDYVYYQLIPVDSKDDTPVAQTDKLSFCIWDEDNEHTDLEYAADERNYFFECQKSIQGMSVGWSDTYDAGFAGQEINITNVEDGRYIFRSIVNPDQKIKELNYDNNISEVVVEINGYNIEVLE